MPEDTSHSFAQQTQNHNQLYTDDVRAFLLDRAATDNPLLMDLAYSDEEINRAKRFACMSFNAITPYVYNLSPEFIPFADIMMLHGVVYHLYLSKVAQLSRQDVDHTAGNMTVDVTKRQIANLQALLALHKKEFETMAKQRKVTYNISQAFRNFNGPCGLGGGSGW